MLSVKLICVGKLKEFFWTEACKEYEKRMKTMCRLEVLQLDEEPERPDALRREAARIEAAIPAGAYVIAMCIEGKELSSTQLAEKLRAVQNGGSSKICLIIGSSNGMDDSIKQRADFRLSMSPMTFPHHLARVMVLEQVYRGLSILAGSKYHK
jgi:23S rRNA (pseudouridine1915-N3)-methyltransferase